MVDKDALLAYQQAMTQLGSDRYNPWRTGARKRENNGAD
jgi:hypothetical protein